MEYETKEEALKAIAEAPQEPFLEKVLACDFAFVQPPAACVSGSSCSPRHTNFTFSTFTDVGMSLLQRSCTQGAGTRWSWPECESGAEAARHPDRLSAPAAMLGRCECFRARVVQTEKL